MKRYEKQKEINKELVDENEKLKVQLESERDLPAIAYMQGAEKQKKKDAEQLNKIKKTIASAICDNACQVCPFDKDCDLEVEE